MLQNATPVRKSAPGPPNTSDGYVSCTARAAQLHRLSRSSSKVPRRFWKCWKTRTLGSFFHCPCHEKRRLPRSVLLSWTCASHHNSVQFFNLSSSRNAPRLWCFCHVHFQMCFNASRLQKCSEHVVLCTF